MLATQLTYNDIVQQLLNTNKVEESDATNALEKAIEKGNEEAAELIRQWA